MKRMTFLALAALLGLSACAGSDETASVADSFTISYQGKTIALNHGVTEFATANVKDFQGFGFTRVWNPLA